MSTSSRLHNDDFTTEQAELRQLISSLLQGGLTDDENHQLDRLLESSPDLLNEYVNQIQIETMLEWSQFEDPIHEQSTLHAVQAARKNQHIARYVALGMSVAALFIVGAFFFNQPATQLTNAPVQPSPKRAALLLDSEDAIWQFRDQSVPFGTHFYVGERLVLDSGIARLALKNGAGVVLEGPCELQLTSDGEPQLHYGTLAAIVPDQVTGFSLLTKTIRIADSGISFGMTVDRTGETEVHAFEGQVVVEQRDHNRQQQTKRIRLKTNESRMFSARKQSHQRMPAVSQVQKFPDMPDREQLEVARTGDYPPKPRRAREALPNDKPFTITKQDTLDTIPDQVLYAEQFSYPGTNLDQALGGKGFDPHPWQADPEFVNIIIPTHPLRMGKLTGGNFALEIAGRHPAYPQLANRISRKLPMTLTDDFYFSFLGQYHGLDHDDFFAFWFDNRQEVDISHAQAPNVGFKNGAFFARFNLDAEKYDQIAPEGKTFLLVGRLTKEGNDRFTKLALWYNPPAIGIERAPDVVADCRPSKHRHRYFSVLGVRIGAYTEPDDRLILDRLVIGTSYQQVTNPGKITSDITENNRKR